MLNNSIIETSEYLVFMIYNAGGIYNCVWFKSECHFNLNI
jgi:hypothetical protein